MFFVLFSIHESLLKMCKIFLIILKLNKRVTRDTEDGINAFRNDIPKTEEDPGLKESANCDFGIGTDVSMCKWSNLNMSAFHWMSSQGDDSYWIGGPQIDDNEKNKQGIQKVSISIIMFHQISLDVIKESPN